MYEHSRELRPNARLGRYELVARLATGGMGEIFLARLEGAAGFEKLFVIKRILPHLAGDGRFRAMMIDEAHITSRLSHSSICAVYELGETDGELYIVMEYLEGLTLFSLMRYAARSDRPLPPSMIGGIANQITEALHFAHELRDRDGTSFNIVHRDVTPSNIFVTESGVAKVLDFGIAKAKNLSTETQAGTVKGKHAYMAPEQLRGQAIDRRVDVYAVGVLLYEALSLRRLFQRQTDYLTLQAVMELGVPDLRAFRPDVPAALAQALARALDRDPERRFGTVRQLGEAIDAALVGPHRAWSQSQLGEELRARFSRELAARAAAVSAAIGSVQEAPRFGADPLARVPNVRDFGEPDDDGGDDELPSVDPAAAAALSFALSAPPAAASARRLPSVADRVDARAAPAAGRSRPWIWPLAALGLLVLGGAGLFAWQARTQAPQTVLVVTDRRGPDAGTALGAQPLDPVARAPAPPVDAGALAPPSPRADDAGSADDAGVAPGGSDGSDARDQPTKRSAKSVLQAKIAALRPQMDDCLRRFPVSAELGGKLELHIEASGKVAAVEIAPRALAATEMASCIERLFRAQRFPKQREALAISLSISTRVR